MSICSTGLGQDERGSINRVRSFKDTAELLGISLPTLRRMITAGDGPTVTRLSERRLGIRDDHRIVWLDARSRQAAE
jgi:hypothetical protein